MRRSARTGTRSSHWRALLVALACLAGVALPAAAVQIRVTDSADDSNGTGPLREAIRAENTDLSLDLVPEPELIVALLLGWAVLLGWRGRRQTIQVSLEGSREPVPVIGAGPAMAPRPHSGVLHLSGAPMAPSFVRLGGTQAATNRCAEATQRTVMGTLWIAYATVEGQSARIADWLVLHARHAGIDAEAVDLAQRPSPPLDCDRVILVASIHRGRHSQEVRSFVRENRAWLAARPSAFLSVSLSAASEREATREAAEELLEGFLASSGWTPDLALSVAGALAYSKYGFFKRRVLRAIAKAEGGPTETSRDYELTDWGSLGLALDEFLDLVPDRDAAPAPVSEGEVAAAR